MMQKLVFFFPWPEVSGGPFFLSRLANEASRRKLYEVYYTDYPNGLCESLLEDRNVRVLKYENEGKDFEIFPEEPVVLVMAEYWAHMVPVVHPQTKIVFFNWHNECIPVLQRDWCASDRYIEKFLRLVRDTSSVFFCDQTHWLAHARGGIIAAEQYVPITVENRNRVASRKLIKEGERNIAVLGRLCLDKIYAVLDLLDHIVRLRDKVKTNVYIIGEGDQEFRLKNRRFPDHVKLIWCGTLKIRDVVALLARRVDILFAMGTSVLEGADIRLPSVIIPNDIKPFECDRYPYVFESKGYSLGWYPEQIDDLGLETHTLEEIFCDIYEKGRKAELGMRCYEYYTRNHMQNMDLFLQAVENSSLTRAKYQEFVRRNPNWKMLKWIVADRLRKFHGYTQKRFSIFGFPLYTHTKTNDIHSNIFICCIPLLRINHIGPTITVHLLPLVWGWRVVQKSVSILLNLLFGKREDEKK